ncbi:hypothetical protein [Prosthecobacter sp.]|uniref:hypothetical protein n=1 Tax=Prosthecobacter sp. TaxID=1965333 RepID=UPI003784837A
MRAFLSLLFVSCLASALAQTPAPPPPQTPPGPPALIPPVATPPKVAPPPAAATAPASPPRIAPPPPAPAPTTIVRERERRVYVPFDELEKVFKDGGKGVFLPYREFLDLWNELSLKREETEKAPPAEAVLAKAEYTGRVEGDSVILEAKITAESFKKGWVLLPFTEKAVPGIGEASTGKAVLRSRSDGSDLMLPEKGVYEITLKIYAPIIRTSGRSRVTLNLPRAAVSRLSLTVPGEGLEFQLEPAAAFTTQVAGGQTQFACFFGAASQQDIAWKSAQAVTQMSPLVLAENKLTTQIGIGSVATTADIALRILRAPINELKIAIPADQEILGVTGAGIKEWKIETGPIAGNPAQARKTIVILPEKPLRDDYSLQLQLEGPVAKLPSEVSVPDIEIVGAAQAHGEVVLGAESQLDVTPKTLTSATRSLAGDSRSQVGTFRILRQPYKLTLDVAEAKPQVEATSLTKLSVRREAASLTADFSYVVRRVGIFEARLTPPADWNITDVKGQIESWNLDGTDLVIKLPKQTVGDFKFTVTARQTRPQATADVVLPVFTPQNVTRHEALVGATIHSSLEPNTKELGGFQQEDVSAVRLQSEPNATEIAFRYRDAAKPATLSLKSRSSQVSVEVLTLVEVKEQSTRHSWTLAFDVAYAATDRFILAVPKDVADQIRFVDQQVKEINKAYQPPQPITLPDAASYILWEVILRSERQGSFSLTLNLERPITLEAGKTGKFDLLHVHVPGAFQETGQVAVVKAPSLEIRKAEPETLEEIDARELRGELQRTGVFLAYKYRSLPIKLGVELAKNSFIPVPQAVITHAALTTAVATDKAQTTEVIYWVKNNDLQFLVVRLPQGSRLQSDVFVDREAQQPMRREVSEDMLVRLPSGDAARTAFPVRFVFESPSPAPGEKLGNWGSLSVNVPQVAEVGIMETRHTLLLPEKEWHYTAFSGPLSLQSHETSWQKMQNFLNDVLPAFGPQLDVLNQAQDSRFPIVQDDVRTLYGSQVQQQGHPETLHRLGPPAEIGVSFRSRRITYLYQALAFLISLIAGVRCWTSPPAKKLRYLAIFGLGSMLLTGLVGAANIPVLLAAMLAAFILLLIWIFTGLLGFSLHTWHRYETWRTKPRATPPSVPPSTPPTPPSTPPAAPPTPPPPPAAPPASPTPAA